MEAQKQTLKLRNNAILIVSRISNQCSAWSRVVARQIGRIWIASALDWISFEKSISTVVQVGLIVGSTAVNIVQIKCRRAKVRQCVGIVLLLQAAGGVKGYIVVDELSEIGIQRGDSAFFVVLAIFRGIEAGGHRLPQLCEIGDIFDVGGSEFCGRKGPKHSSESALKQGRVLGRHQSAERGTVFLTH